MPLVYKDEKPKDQPESKPGRRGLVYKDETQAVPQIANQNADDGKYLFRIGKPGGKPFGDSWGGMAGNVALGGLESIMAMAAGLPSSTAGAIASTKGMISGGRAGNDQTIEAMQRAMEKYGYQPQTDAGKRMMEIAAYPFRKIEDVANKASDKVFEKTDSVPLTLATNIGIQAAPEVLATAVGMRMKSKAKSRAANLSDRQILAIDAHKKGYRVNQAEINPTLKNRVESALSYQPDVDAELSKRNQIVTQMIANEDNRLPRSARISREDMARVRATEGVHYNAVKAKGGDITLSANFHNKVGNASGPAFPKTSFGEATNPAIKAISSDLSVLTKNKVSLAEAVDKWQDWRDAAAAYRDSSISDTPKNRTYSKRIARFYDDAQSALKEEIVNELVRRGDVVLAKNFDEAAKRIAVAHTTSSAIVPGPNVVSARKLGIDLMNDVPISGGLNTTARMANSFSSLMDTGLGSPPFSQLDATSAAGTAASALSAAAGVGQPHGMFRGGTLPVVRTLAKKAVLRNAEKGFNPYALPNVSKYPALVLALEAYQESLKKDKEQQ